MRIKRWTAALICFALLQPVLALPAGAEGPQTPAAPCECGQVVQIWIEGFSGPLYYDWGTPEQRDAGFVRTDNLTVSILKTVGWLLLSMLLPCSGKIFARGAATLMDTLMGHLKMDEQGRSIEPITNHWSIDKSQNHTLSPEYRFYYDWRMDLCDAAVQLDEFIEELCAHTGHQTIALSGHSEGANVVMAYVAAEGTGRLNTLILSNGAWQGLSLVGQLFVKDFELNGAAVADYIAIYDKGDGKLRNAMNVLRKLHLLDFVKPLGKLLLRFAGDALFDQVLTPLFGNMPAVWSFVPDEYFEESLKILGNDPKYDALKEKITAYHRNVFLKAPDLLRNAKANGVKVAVIAAYGPAPLPLTKNSSYLSDSLIDTAAMSGGATTAPRGKTLPPGDSKFRSPDGMIDAGTCVLPEQTWFIKNNVHEHGASYGLRQWIIHREGIPTVFDKPEEFPQYLVRTAQGGAEPLIN